MDSQCDAVEQVEEIVSPLLLPQKWEMELVKNFYDERFAFMYSEWLPHGGLSLESELSDVELCDEFGKQQQEQQDPQPSTEPKRPQLLLFLRKRERDPDELDEDKHTDGSVLKDSTNTCRFGSPSSEKKLEEAAKGVIPKNSVNNTRWAENNFLAWAKERNKHVLDDPVPLDLLKSQDTNLVNKHLCRYILET